MFDRITISNVPASRTVRIAFSMLKPQGWSTAREDEWLAFGPRSRHDVGFALLMPHFEGERPEQLLRDEQGAQRYLHALFPDLELVETFEDEEIGVYEIDCFRGRITGVPGRILIVAATVPVEDINFALFGFSCDERFHLVYPLFRAIVSSFQPVVTASRE